MKSDTVTLGRVYELIDSRIDKVNESIQRIETKLDRTQQDIASINGGIKIVPFLISTAMGIFSIIISIALSRIR